jgi:hypothetical protein
MIFHQLDAHSVGIEEIALSFMVLAGLCDNLLFVILAGPAPVRSTAAAVLKGPTVWAVVALSEKGVAPFVGETPVRFSGSNRYSPPNLSW